MLRSGEGRIGPRPKEWERFAREFEFEPASQLAEPLREQFALGDEELEPVYALRRSGQPLVIAFDQLRERSGPAGSVATLRTFVAVRGEAGQASPSMRAAPRRTRALEALEASRSGAKRLSMEHDPEFDESVSVFARDLPVARGVLTPQVRQVLRRLLLAADAATQAVSSTAVGGMGPSAVAPSVVMGQRSLLLCLEPRQALPLADLGDMVVELLSLHVALDAAGRHLANSLLG